MYVLILLKFMESLDLHIVRYYARAWLGFSDFLLYLAFNTVLNAIEHICAENATITAEYFITHCIEAGSEYYVPNMHIFVTLQACTCGLLRNL